MGGNATCMDHFQAMHIQQILKTGQGVIAKVFVINSVVLQSLHQRHKVVRFGNEDSVIPQQFQNRLDDLMNIFNMREDVGCGYDFRLSVLGSSLLCRCPVKKRDGGWNAASIRQFGCIRWFDTEDSMSAILKITEQGAVIRPNIDDQVLRS